MSKFQVVSKTLPNVVLRNHLSKRVKPPERRDDKNIFDPVTSTITVAEQTAKSMENLGRKLINEAKLMNETMLKCSKELNDKIVGEMESAPIKTNNPVESFLNRTNDIAPHIIRSSQTMTIHVLDSLQRVITEILNESKKIVLSSNQVTKSTSNKAMAMIDDIYYKSTITNLWRSKKKKSETLEDWERKLMSTDQEQKNDQKLALTSNEENNKSLMKMFQAILDSIRKWGKEEKVVAIPPKSRKIPIYSKLNAAIQTLQEIGKDVEAQINKEKPDSTNNTALSPYQLQSRLDSSLDSTTKTYTLRSAIKEIINAIQTIGQDPNYFENLEKEQNTMKLVQNTQKILGPEQQEVLNRIKLALNNVNDTYLLELLVKRINDNINVLKTSLKLKSNNKDRSSVRVGKDYHSRAAAVEDATHSFLMQQHDKQPIDDNKFKSATEKLKIDHHKARIENVEKAARQALSENLATNYPLKPNNSSDFETRIVTAEKDTMRCLLQMRTLSEITQKEFDDAMAAIKNEKNNAYNRRLLTIINVLENVIYAKNLKTTTNISPEMVNLTALEPMKILPKTKAQEKPVIFSTKQVENLPLKVNASTAHSGVQPIPETESISKILTDIKDEGLKTILWLIGLQHAENNDLKRLEHFGKIPPVPNVTQNPPEEMLKSGASASSGIEKPFRDLSETEKMKNLEMYFVERLLSVEQLIIRKVDGIQYRRLLGFDYTKEIQAVDEIIKRNLDNFNNEISAAVQTWSTFLPSYRKDKVVAQAEKVKADVKTLQLTICHELDQMKMMNETSAYGLEKTVRVGIRGIQEATFEIIRNALEMNI